MKGDVSHLWSSLKQWFATVVLQQGHVQQDADTDGKYVPLRRLLLFLEDALERGLQWVRFEPRA